MQSAIIALIILSLKVTFSDANVAILLGQCDNFAVESSAGITFDGRLTTVSTGDIGVSPGTSITGSYRLGDGSVQRNSPLAIGCTSDLATAYRTAWAAYCPPSRVSVEADKLIWSVEQYTPGKRV